MRIKLQKKLICGLIAVLLLTQTSCMDLEGLRKFTDESVKAGAKFKALSQDVYRSCAAETYYLKLKTNGFKDIYAFDSAEVFLARDDVGPDEQKACEDFKTNWSDLRKANKVLMTYLYVMGQIAADDVANTDEEFKQVKASLSSLPVGANPILTAASSIANTITNALVDAKRRKAIRQAVLSHDADITRITDGLSNSLNDYITQLNEEKDQLDGMYDFALAGHKKFVEDNGGKSGSFDPLLALSNRDGMEAEVQKINAKITAAKAYQKILSEIKKGHNELYLEAQRGFNIKEAVKIALKYAPAIQDNFDELAEAF